MRLALPEAGTATPEVVRLELRRAGSARRPTCACIPADYVFRYPRVAIAADVVFDGRRLGQITEATVETAGEEADPVVGSGMEQRNLGRTGLKVSALRWARRTSAQITVEQVRHGPRRRGRHYLHPDGQCV